MRTLITTLTFAALFPLPAHLLADAGKSASRAENVEVVESNEAIPLPSPAKDPEAAKSDDTREAPSTTATKAGEPLSAEELASSLKTDAITIPSPGELMAALGKEAQPNWQSRYRAPIPTTFTSRAQIALNIGGLIADGYIALQAKDSQQIKNTGKDIITLAKSLAVSENVIARGNSIIDFADNNQWTALQEELGATQNEVKLALQEQRDNDLVTLVTVGAWIRGTAILSSFIAENYTEPSARLLRQPGIIAYMRGKLAELPERIQSDKLVRSVDKRLAKMESLVAFPEGAAPSPEAVTELKDLAEGLVTEISKKED